jgi:acyl-coenzyme A thioesterase PaaI-like protein
MRHRRDCLHGGQIMTLLQYIGALITGAAIYLMFVFLLSF